jgi:hypothetical protein
MSQSVHRLVRNQILFREVNERVRETVGSADMKLDFVCECSNEACIETVTLGLVDYDAIRSRANLFVVTAGHELPEIERIIDQGDGYVLVAKMIGVESVEAANPRSRGG